jgi:hypothetical protein
MSNQPEGDVRGKNLVPNSNWNSTTRATLA